MLSTILALVLVVLALAVMFQFLRVRERVTELEGQMAAAERRFSEIEKRQAVLFWKESATSGSSREIATQAHHLPRVPSRKVVEIVPDTPPQSDVPSGSPPSPSATPSDMVSAPDEDASANLVPEERLAARWSVWIGALALALGGVFLVRASIEAGLLGPGVRIALGALFSLALLGGGEWLRRRIVPMSFFGGAYAPGALTAAGAVVAFAVAFAAHALYGFIGPFATFLILGAIGLAAMLAAALHGPPLAAIGLLGSLVAPLLVGSASTSTWPIVPYVAIVAVAAYGVARLRRWLWLALSAATGAGFWTLLLLAGDSGPLLVHVVLQLALAVVVFVALPFGRDRVVHQEIDFVASLVLAGYAGLAVLAMAGGDVGPAARVAFAGLVAAILLGSALHWTPAAAGAIMGTLVAGGALATWPLAMEIRGEQVMVLPGGGVRLPWPEALESFLAFAAVVGVAMATGCVMRLLRRPTPSRIAAVTFAAVAVGAPLFLLVVVYAVLTDQFRLIAAAPVVPLAAVAGLIAAAYAALATQLRDALVEERESPRRLLLAGAAAASLAGLATGLVFTLDRGFLTVALALTALGSAFVSDRTRIPTLRWAVGIIGIVVALRLFRDPLFVEDPGQAILFNWLLVGYGVPAVAFALAARLLDRTARDDVSRIAEGLAFVFGAFLVFFQIRHAVHGGDLLAYTFGHMEAGLLATAALALSALATRIDIVRSDLVTRWASFAFAAIALAFVASGLLFANPLLTGEAIAGPVLFNSLLPAYLVPALLAGILARMSRSVHPASFADGAALLGLALATIWIGLAIRHTAQGAIIELGRATTEGEMWAYSVALIASGVAALAVGFVRDDHRARLVGILFFGVAALKVFLVDLASLEGVMRAASFIGLGLALVGLGLAYQRIVAGHESGRGSDRHRPPSS